MTKNRLRSYCNALIVVIPAIFLMILVNSTFSVGYAVAAELPAFPGAKGFGSDTAGGRGGKVIKVTNTNESGPGSLKAAIDASGPRIVVFDTGGTIKLTNSLDISNPYITIAGQTAPGSGIMIQGAAIKIKTHDVIVRGIRARAGDGPHGSLSDKANRDCFDVTGKDSYNVIVDHCSFSWAIDEMLSVYNSTSHDVTFSRCIFSESLYHHPYWEDTQSMGGGPGKGPLAGTGTRNVAFIENVFAHNWERNPRFTGASGVVVNNVHYNRGYKDIQISGLKGDTQSFSVVGNHFIKGKNYSSNDKSIYLSEMQNGSKIYVNDNDCSEYTTGNCYNNATYISASPPVWPAGLIAMDVKDVKSSVLSDVGASIPQDSTDARIIASVKNKTGSVINCVVKNSEDSDCNDPGEYAEASSWPTYTKGSAPADADDDGMPDSWETEQGLNPNNPSDAGGDQDGDGYTNIEEYINGLFTGDSNVAGPPPEDDNPPPQNANEVAFMSVADTSVSSGSPSTNFGSASALEVDGSPEKITYLRFNVNGLGEAVQSARLRLTVADASSVGGTIHSVSDDNWNENVITFNTRPAIDGPTLDSLAAVSVGDIVELDVTPSIDGNGTFSFAIVSSGSNGADYNSRENGTNPPELIITTNGEQDNSTPLNPTALRIRN